MRPLDGVTVVGEKDLHLALIRLPRRLDNAAVDGVAQALDRICPPRITPARADVPEPRHAAPEPVETAHDGDPEALFEPEEVWRALLEAACAAAGHPLTLHRRDGHDHSYYFIASFIGEHLAHHARALKA